MPIPGQADIDRFRRDGYIVVERAITPRSFAVLQDQVADWVEESRGHAENYGTTLDHRHRFDLETGHTADMPRLRRVNNPAEISAAFREAALDGAIADCIAALIGPDVKFHHCKINLKLPGTETRVGYHQDYSYTPHTNDDIVTALLMLDDVTLDNGCLMVVPGSHLQGQVSLWSDDTFTGEAPPALTAEYESRAVAVAGRAGDLCLMHTSLMHGSAPNASDRARGLFIAVYTAADAFPLCGSPLPNRYEGKVVRGAPSRVARLKGGSVELPAAYGNTSFFEVQGQKSATSED